MHTLPSSHGEATPDLHLPPAQLSPVVQTLPSSQGTLLLATTQPLLASQLSFVQGFTSSHTLTVPGLHWPPLHTSPSVQTLPSLQATVLAECTQPANLSHESSVHGLPSSQLWLLPLLHRPLRHWSPTVQTLPSSQANVLLACLQPCLVSQESVVQATPSSQSSIGPGAHWPPLQPSSTVHALPSLQLLALLRLTQPLPPSHRSVVHGLPSSQTLAAPPWQLPPLQVSPSVQILLSLQGNVLAEVVHPTLASQPSLVQGLPSSQTLTAPGLQVLALQTSPSVQALLSLHGAVFAVVVHPALASQPSSVHGLPSLQVVALPGVQIPLEQTSPSVQMLPSSQGKLLLL